jgi:hypothetical protein
MVAFFALLLAFTVCYALSLPISIGGYKNSKKDDASDIVASFFTKNIDNLIKI